MQIIYIYIKINRSIIDLEKNGWKKYVDHYLSYNYHLVNKIPTNKLINAIKTA